MSFKETPGARLALETAAAPFTSGKARAAFGCVAVLALALPLSSCGNFFKNSFDGALDAMDTVLRNDGGAFGRCVTKASTSEWKIKTPNGEQTFPVLQTQSMISAYAGGTNCFSETELRSLKEQFEGIKATLTHCPKGACSVTWPQQQTISYQ